MARCSFGTTHTTRTILTDQCRRSTATTDLVVKPTRAETVPPPERPVNDLMGQLVDVESLGPSISRFRRRQKKRS